jgi:hypothetical protein
MARREAEVQVEPAPGAVEEIPAVPPLDDGAEKNGQPKHAEDERPDRPRRHPTLADFLHASMPPSPKNVSTETFRIVARPPASATEILLALEAASPRQSDQHIAG